MTDSTYGAFISYRRGGTDEAVARVLHRQLERYRTPRRLVRTGIASRIGRVFLDTAEREAAPDLDQAIRSALDASRWLIVVCSKRTPESSWVSQEIAHFAAGRQEKILALLIDGEPEESYPTPLREGVEPKAADIRSSTRAEALVKLKRSEKLALLAPMLGVRYDDLKLRERQRKRRQAAVLASVVGVLLAGFALMLVMIRAERLRSELFETLDGIEAAIQQNDHQRAAALATQALSLDREHGLDKGHEIERVIRDGFDLPFFRRTISEVPAEVRSVAVSDDGSRIAFATRGGNLVVLEREGEEYASRELDTLNEEITTLAYQAGTGLLAAGTANGIVFLFNSDDVDQFEIGFARINQLVFSPEGERLVIASEDGLFVRSTATADPRLRTLEDSSVVHSAAFSGAGDWLASTTGNNIVIRQIPTDSAGTVYGRLALPLGFDALHVDIDPESFRLIATSFLFHGQSGPQSVVFVWEDFRNAATLRRVFTSDDISLRARFSNTGEILVFGANTAMRFFDGAGRVSEPVDGVAPSSVALRGLTNEIITIDSESGDLVSLDFFARALSPLVLSFDAPVRDLTFVGEHGDVLAVAYHGDAAPTLWQLHTLVPRRASLGSAEPSWSAGTALNRLAAAPNQPHRLIGALNRTLHDDENLVIWNPSQAGERSSPLEHRGNANDVALGPSGELLVSVGSIESVVKLHDFRTGETKDLKVPTSAPLIAVSVSVDSSGTRVAVGDQQGSVFLLDADDNEVVELTSGADPAPSELSVRFSPDGEWLATSGPAGVRVFRSTDDFRAFELKPDATALDVAFSPDGTALFAAIDDGQVLRWSLEQPGHDAFVLRPPGSPATAVAVSPDDKTVAAGFADGTIVVWSRFPEMVAYLLEAAAGHR